MNSRGEEDRHIKGVKREDEVEGREIGERVDYVRLYQRGADNCDERIEKEGREE